ncbi:MAG: pyrroline-5-carboxylate reductase [Deltaproteobacteria bacterium]|jgi:pyrroline-5-carboxylate reductase|nr:pyrroline-5-carboxylate reductase [Deltaproteobacteria bacterium]
MTKDALAGRRIGFIGAGNMAEAIIRGLLESEAVKPDHITASDVMPERLKYMQSTYGIRTLADNDELVGGADILVLAVKPQVVGSVLTHIGPRTDDTKLVISIVAGLTVAAMAAGLGAGTRIIRTVPNTPVFVGEGMVALASDGPARDEDFTVAEALFAPVARIVSIEEKLMDAALGVSGSGPAYGFLMIEALSDGGVKMGLPRHIALELAAQTLLGAAKMCLESGRHPGQLKDMVTSPGGTTIAALHKMEAGGVRSALMDAVEAATRRSEELGRLG